MTRAVLVCSRVPNVQCISGCCVPAHSIVSAILELARKKKKEKTNGVASVVLALVRVSSSFVRRVFELRQLLPEA